MTLRARALSTSLLVLLASAPLTAVPPPGELTPVLHSVSYAGVWRGQARLDVDAFLLKAKELGFSHVELVGKRPHVSPLDYDAAARARLRARMQELGLTLACLAAYPDFTAGVDKPGIPAAEIGAVYVGETARLAKELGTSCVRVFTGYERPGVPADVQWGVVVQGLKLAAKEAASHGVTLAVQNHHDIAVHPDALLWLVKEVDEPNVRAAFDAWSPALAGVNGEDLAAAARKLAPYMAYTTVADYVKHPRLHYDATLTNYLRGDDLVRAVPFGTGFIDYRAFFRGLREGGYRGYVAYEMCEVLEGGGSIENLDRTARAFLQTFRAMVTPPRETRSLLESEPSGWIDIQPAPDLAGWTRGAWPPAAPLGPQQWRVDPASGHLLCDGQGGHDWLRYDRELGDVAFHVDWRFTPVQGADRYNSGVLVRTAADLSVWLQAQTGGGRGGHLFGNTLVDGKVQRVNLASDAASQRVRPAGEWNTYELVARGPLVSLWVNGAVTSEITRAEARRGHVGLEGEGWRIEFRNLKIKPLD